MTDKVDPLENIEHPTLAERIEPYRRYGDPALALYLWHYEKYYGDCGIASPAVRGADYHCPDCEENVRAVSLPDGQVLRCPLCGETPGLLTIGAGPQ